MSVQHARVELSVIVPVGNRHSDIPALYQEYRNAVATMGIPFQFVFVLDGPDDERAKLVSGLGQDTSNITVVRLTRFFGESTALMAGFEQALGELILILPAYHQIEASEIPKLIAALETSDLVIAHRSPRAGGGFERLRRRAFHSLLNRVTGLSFHDLGCGARAMRRQVLEEIQLYGDQSRFLPVLADRQGFRVREVAARQSTHDRRAGIYGPRDYARGLLDIFTVFFLVRFTKKPLRFFGMIGVAMFGIGAALIAYLTIDRLFFDHALADRPALLLSSLLLVLGLQLFAIGLLGELIIFTHAKEMKDYKVDKVVQFSEQNAARRIESPSSKLGAA